MSTRSNPVTPQAPVVINGWFDRHFSVYRSNRVSGGKQLYPGLAIENFNLMPRELGFALVDRWDKWLSRPDTARGSDYGPRIFTSVNGFPTDHLDTHGGPSSMLRELRKQVVFVGVPLVAIDAANANQKDGVAICVAGSTSIFNTGNKRINTGELVLWDFPPNFERYGAKNSPHGEPHSKHLFMTVPADTTASAQQLLDEVWDAKDAESKSGKRPRDDLDPDVEVVLSQLNKLQVNDRTAVNSFAKAVTMAVSSAHRRAIGLALSSAEPGEQFDILIRTGAAY